MEPHVCPVWVGYLLASPLRRLLEPPGRLFDGFVGPGMRVLDAGCAMGYFSLAAARRVGPDGRVVAVDLQPGMIEALRRRAQRADLADRIEARTCPMDSLGLEDLTGSFDVALAIHVVHETPDAAAFLGELHQALRPGGHLLLGEPRGHVCEADFEESLALAIDAGFEVQERRHRLRSWHAILKS